VLQLADRITKIKPSPTIAVTAKANQLKAAGIPVIGLGMGEPDFDTPEHIKEAGVKAIRDGATKYTPVGGTLSLKEAIIQKLATDNNLVYSPDEIIVSSGAKHSIFNILQVLLQPGDEVIILAPFWVSYIDMVVLTGATPVVINANIEQDYKVSAEQIKARINSKTKLIFINSPSNPTGMAYSIDELKQIANVILAHRDLLVLTDDIYEKILWSKESFANIAMVCPELSLRTLVVNGVSKAYAMTGWRIGYTAGPKDIIQAMHKLQGQNTSNPCSISQVAATAALQGPQDSIDIMLKAYKERHDFLVKRIQAIPKWHVKAGQGTFYAFANVAELIEQTPSINNDVELATVLLEKAQVALVPGSAFGAPGCLRLSFAASMTDLTTAMNSLESINLMD